MYELVISSCSTEWAYLSPHSVAVERQAVRRVSKFYEQLNLNRFCTVSVQDYCEGKMLAMCSACIVQHMSGGAAIHNHV